ncbi:MAG: DUF5989 family protein [Planctomycetota bacterium]|nr:DUF5989 family protein [Planctomycetota bacterium]
MRNSTARDTADSSNESEGLSQKQIVPDPASTFIEEANKPQLTLLEEFIHLAVHDRKWWIVPLMLSLVFVAIAVALTQSAIVPFVYTLF